MVSASAYSFGNSIKQLVEDKSEKIALVYGTRYGATKDTFVGQQVKMMPIRSE